MLKDLILYHASCADGFAAAWAARLALGAGQEYVPAHYGSPLPENTDGRRVYLLDFSYKRPEMEALAAGAASVVVLDHHKTAEAELAGLAGDRLTVRFDMGKSGGRLAWEFFHPHRPVPWLIEYTEDRDLWLWKLPDSRAVSAYLASRPFDFDLWDGLDDQLQVGCPAWRDMITEGTAIIRYQDQKVKEQARLAGEVEIDGHRVLAMNATHLISEIAGKLAEGRPFGACFFIRADGRKVWSLRSRDGGVDVSEIAKRRGGGGHRNAAGFTE